MLWNRNRRNLLEVYKHWTDMLFGLLLLYLYSGNKRVKAEKFSYESMRRQLFSNKRFFFYTTTHVSVSFVFVDGGGVNINIVIVIDVTVDIGCNLQLAPKLAQRTDKSLGADFWGWSFRLADWLMDGQRLKSRTIYLMDKRAEYNEWTDRFSLTLTKTRFIQL